MWAKEHATLLTGLGSTALIAARLLAVSRFDVNTAASILQITGPAATVAGTALTLLPFALVLLVCVLAIAAFVDPTLLRLGPDATRAALIVASGALVCLTAVSLVAGTAVFVAATAAVGRQLRRHGEHTDVAAAVRRSRLLTAQVWLLFTVLALAPIVVQRPWLPVQVVVLDDGTRYVGYLLGEADGDMAVLSDDDRTVSFLDPGRVRERRICAGGSRPAGAARRLPRWELDGSALGAVLWGRDAPRYPRCPTPTAP